MLDDPDFQSNLVLLLLGALVSGFGIPYVLRVIDSRKLRQQKELDAALNRQTKLLDAQSALLDDLTRLLWEWRYLAKSVVYYGARGDADRYDDVKGWGA